MNTTSQTRISTWNRMVHAPFKKVVAYDLLFMGLGAIIGAFTVAGLLLQ